MKNPIVIKKANLPTYLPVTKSGFWIFVMYYFNAPGWAWGVFLTLLAILWIAVLFRFFKEEEADLFDIAAYAKQGMNSAGIKSRFMERLDKAMEDAEKAKAKKEGGSV